MPDRPMPVRSEFEPIPLNPTGELLVRVVREEFSRIADKIDEILKGNSRAKSLAFTKLQEACMWTVRGVAETPDYNDKIKPPFTPAPVK